MTKFERDMREVKEGNGIEVMKRRKAELEKLYDEGRKCKNAFRRQCIAQEYSKRKEEYSKLDEMF